MTNIKKILAFGAMASMVMYSFSVFAIDLEKQLKATQDAFKDVGEKSEIQEAAPAKEEAKDEKKAEEEKPAAKEEKKAETKAEEKKEDVADEKKAEEKKDEKKEEVAEAEEVEEEKPEAKKDEKKDEKKEEVAEAEEKDDGKDKKEEVAEEKAPAKVETKPDVDDKELIENLRATQVLSKKALDLQAAKELKEARACMEGKEYIEAVQHYKLAKQYLGDRPAAKNLRRECEQGMAEGFYRAAYQEDKLGRRDQAIEYMTNALELRHPKASRALERWQADAESSAGKQVVPENVHRQNDEEYKAERAKIKKHLEYARYYLSCRDMKHALEECETVLASDNYNQEAHRLRKEIQRKRHVILEQQREHSREGMISDVDEAWRPAYAVNAAKLNETSVETVKTQAGEDPERTKEQEIERRMKEMRLPQISFKPPATIIDAVDFFRGASKDFDRPDIPLEKRGFNFVLRPPQGALKQEASAEQEEASNDFTDSGEKEEDASQPTNGLAPIPTITASDISFYEALNLVCESVHYKFIIRGTIVMVMEKDMSTDEILSRKYNVPEAFIDRVTSASEEMKTMGGFGGGNSSAKKDDEEEGSKEKDWQAFFKEMGVQWPKGSSIKHIKSLGKLYVRNTRENLAEFEKVLEELGGQPQLIEIETRFVEVSQEDLNSLGFEWILNSDYSLDLGSGFGEAFNNGQFKGSRTATQTLTGYTTTTTSDGGTTTQVLTPTYATTWTKTSTQGASWERGTGDRANLGINAFGGTSEQQNGNRYLSTVGNHISGDAESTNDQFMRFNAFLGEADLSMILHMLSQRSDTDLLSAPKVVTKSGETATIKVVTEYIYPQDYNVQLQSSSSSSGSSSSGSSGSQSAILAVVEPQNFTMREQGVILEVLPTYSEANGGTIDLELKPQVVDEPTWYNYGMQIPFTGNTSGSGSFEGLGDMVRASSEALASVGSALSDTAKAAFADKIVSTTMTSLENFSTSSKDNMTWYDAPMKQPFFHVRSVDSKVSITPGATVVMGGLITEQRKAMDDKVPFLGDLPFIGRFFRSHAEQTIKRNLLIFVTGRLITPAGRELHLSEVQSEPEGAVKEAPKAE